MKRIFIFFLVICVLLPTLCVAVSADRTVYDFSVTAEEKNLLDLKDEETVIIKYCNGGFLYPFAHEKPIEDILTDDRNNETLFLCCSKDGTFVSKRIQDGKVWDVYVRPGGTRAYFFQKYALRPQETLSSISPQIKVQAVYCLCGESSNEGNYIYFVTDQGDYVLFQSWNFSSDLYLLPINDMQVYAAECLEVERTGDLMGGFNPKTINLSKYKYSTWKSHLSLWISFAISSCIIITGGFLIRFVQKKFKRRKEG